ncbi:ABC transporter ATP-binding protein [Clostridia bacterium]|nr:ABC transporter ATP-binding protein [Clostridia bacterium]
MDNITENILELHDVETFIGQYHILFGVNITVRKGSATVLLGRNGGGKTTTLETISGLRPPFAGTILLDGKDIAGLPAYEIIQSGVGYVPEDRDIFSDLTIEENLLISSRKGNDYDKRLELVFELFPDMKKYFKKKSRILSGGQAQMLSISRALINDNKLILIDEPSKGLAPILIRELIDRINIIKKDNTVLLVEQNWEMATSVGDYFYIVQDGMTVFECTKEELLADDTIKQKYLGV